MLVVSDRSVMGVPLSSKSPAASINALRVKCRGRVKAAPAASAASEALTRLRTSTECEGRSDGHGLRSVALLRELAAFVKAEVAAVVADDQVIEQRDVEHVSGGTQAEREPRVVRTRGGITARMVVDDHHTGRARCETRGEKHVRQGHWRAGARATREHMPGEEAMSCGDTGDTEDFNGLIGDQRAEDGRGVPWVVERHGRHVDDATVAVAQRAVGENEFAHAVAALRIRRKADKFHHRLLSVRAWP